MMQINAVSANAWLDSHLARGAQMDVIEAIYQRRSIRAFTTEIVAAGLVEQLVSAATQAPSAMDLQPWASVIIEVETRSSHIRPAPSGIFSTPWIAVRRFSGIATSSQIRHSISFTAHLC